MKQSMRALKNFNMYGSVETILSKSRSAQLLLGARETASVLLQLEKMSRELSKDSFKSLRNNKEL